MAARSAGIVKPNEKETKMKSVARILLVLSFLGALWGVAAGVALNDLKQIFGCVGIAALSIGFLTIIEVLSQIAMTLASYREDVKRIVDEIE